MSNNTPCKDCVFAKYEEDTQTDCRLDLISKFKDQDVEIMEVYDEDKEFYVIKNRICHFFRPQKWKKDYSLEEQLKAVRLETKIPFSAIVFVENDYKGLLKTLASIYKQTFKISHITVVRSKNSLIIPSDITNVLKKRPIQWRVENLRLDPITNWQAFHLVQKFCRFPYHAVFQSGYKIEKTFFENMNKAIIEDMKQFALIQDEPSDSQTIGSGFVVPESVYDYFYFRGDPSKTITENIQEQEKCQNQKLILTKNHLCCQGS